MTLMFVCICCDCRQKSDKKTPLPPYVESLKKRANAFFEKEQYNKAIVMYNQAIARAPRASMLYGNRAAAYMKRKWYVFLEVKIGLSLLTAKHFHCQI